MLIQKVCALKITKVPCISGPKFFFSLRMILSSYVTTLYMSTCSVQKLRVKAGPKCGIFGKTMKVYLLQICFVLEIFGNNWTSIALRIASRLFLWQYGEIFVWTDFLFKMLLSVNAFIKLHSHQTADQPTTNGDQFLWLGRVWSGKKLPALIEERIYPRSTPAVSLLHPWCTDARIPLLQTYSRPFVWPIPALHDQPPIYSRYKYAHYAQYKTNPRSACLISTPGLKWLIQANVMPTESLTRVQYPKCAYGPYC